MKDVFECKQKCMDTNGCKFYVFGKGSKYGKCYWEKTEPDKNNKICPEKWKNNEYDFYQVLGMLIVLGFFKVHNILWVFTF